MIRAALLALTLTGCSALQAFDAATGLVNPDDGGISVDTELVVGDKKQDLSVGDTNQQAKEIKNEKVSNYQVDPMLLVLLVFLAFMIWYSPRDFNGLLRGKVDGG